MRTPPLQCAAILTLATLALTTPLNAQAGVDRELIGLSRLVVRVDVDADALSQKLDTTRLRTVLELGLRQAGGITVVPPEAERSDDGWLLLEIMTMLRQDNSQTISVVELSVRDVLTLERPQRPPLRVFAPIWEGRQIIQILGLNRSFTDTMAENARALLEEFLNAYLAANPRRGPP